jgi:hypothetical protein
MATKRGDRRNLTEEFRYTTVQRLATGSISVRVVANELIVTFVSSRCRISS